MRITTTVQQTQIDVGYKLSAVAKDNKPCLESSSASVPQCEGTTEDWVIAGWANLRSFTVLQETDVSIE